MRVDAGAAARPKAASEGLGEGPALRDDGDRADATPLPRWPRGPSSDWLGEGAGPGRGIGRSHPAFGTFFWQSMQ